MKILLSNFIILSRDVTIGATGATAVAPKFSDNLTLSQPRGADYAHHRRGRSYHFPVVTSLQLGTVHASGLGLLVGQPNANLVSRPYLVKVLTRFVGMSKKCKIMLM